MKQLMLDIEDGDTQRRDSADRGVLPTTAAPIPDEAEHHTDSFLPKRYTFRGGYRGRAALYRHQVSGITRLSNRDVLLLGDEQGLGKTLQALYAQCVRMKRHEIDGVVVVCYRRHVALWVKAIRQFEPRILPMLQVISGNKKTKRVYNGKMRFWIVNYELLAMKPRRRAKRYSVSGPASIARPLLIAEDAARLLSLCKSRRIAMVCDESQALRTPTSRRTRVLTNIGAHCVFRYALTGTAAAERVWDLWSQMFFLDHGRTLGKSYAAFLARHAVMRQTRYGDKPVRGKNLQEVNERIRPIFLRRLKKHCLDLPKKTIYYTPTLFEGKDRAALLKTQGALSAILDRVHDEYGETNLAAAGVKTNSPLMAQVPTLMSRLAVMSAMPCIVDKTLTRGVKYEMLLDAMDQRTCPLIVWCAHRIVARSYADALMEDGYTVGMISGDVPMKKRASIQDDFEDGKLDVLVCTLATMNDGATLVRSHHAIYVQRNYERLMWKQSQDRIDRIGQTMPVTIETYVSDLGLDLHHGCVIAEKNHELSIAIDGKRASTFNASSLSALRAVLRETDYQSVIDSW